MQKQHGMILVMALIFLMLLSLFTISILQSSIESRILLNMQNIHSKLFMEADAELQLAETQIAQHNFMISMPSQLVTDQQFLMDQIPISIFKHCEISEGHQQKCYFIELISKENCNPQIGQPSSPVLFYRFTAKVSENYLINQSDILQSTYAVLPTNIKQCRLLNSLTDTEYYLYAGRQSWREVSHLRRKT